MATLKAEHSILKCVKRKTAHSSITMKAPLIHHQFTAFASFLCLVQLLFHPCPPVFLGVRGTARLIMTFVRPEIEMLPDVTFQIGSPFKFPSAAFNELPVILSVNDGLCMLSSWRRRPTPVANTRLHPVCKLGQDSRSPEVVSGAAVGMPCQGTLYG